MASSCSGFSTPGGSCAWGRSLSSTILAHFEGCLEEDAGDLFIVVVSSQAGEIKTTEEATNFVNCSNDASKRSSVHSGNSIPHGLWTCGINNYQSWRLVRYSKTREDDALNAGP